MASRLPLTAPAIKAYAESTPFLDAAVGLVANAVLINENLRIVQTNKLSFPYYDATGSLRVHLVTLPSLGEQTSFSAQGIVTSLTSLTGDNRLSFNALKDTPASMAALTGATAVSLLAALSGADRLSYTSLKDTPTTPIALTGEAVVSLLTALTTGKLGIGAIQGLQTALDSNSGSGTDTTRLRKVDVLTEAVVSGEQVIGRDGFIYLGQGSAPTPATQGSGREDVTLIAGSSSNGRVFGFVSSGSGTEYGSLDGVSGAYSSKLNGITDFISLDGVYYLYIRSSENKIASFIIINENKIAVTRGALDLPNQKYEYTSTNSVNNRFRERQSYEINIEFSDGTFAFQTGGTPEIPGDLEWAKQPTSSGETPIRVSALPASAEEGAERYLVADVVSGGGGGTGRVDVDYVAGTGGGTIGFSVFVSPNYGSLNGVNSIDGLSELNGIIQINASGVWIQDSIGKSLREIIIDGNIFPVLSTSGQGTSSNGLVGTFYATAPLGTATGETYKFNVRYTDGTFAFGEAAETTVAGKYEYKGGVWIKVPIFTKELRTKLLALSLDAGLTTVQTATLLRLVDSQPLTHTLLNNLNELLNSPKVQFGTESTVDASSNSALIDAALQKLYFSAHSTTDLSGYVDTTLGIVYRTTIGASRFAGTAGNEEYVVGGRFGAEAVFSVNFKALLETRLLNANHGLVEVKQGTDAVTFLDIDDVEYPVTLFTSRTETWGEGNADVYQTTGAIPILRNGSKHKIRIRTANGYLLSSGVATWVDAFENLLRKVDVATEPVVSGEQVLGTDAIVYKGQGGPPTPAVPGGAITLTPGVVFSNSRAGPPRYGWSFTRGTDSSYRMGGSFEGGLVPENLVAIYTQNRLDVRTVAGSKAVGTVTIDGVELVRTGFAGGVASPTNWGGVAQDYYVFSGQPNFEAGRTYEIYIKYADGTDFVVFGGAPEIPGDLEWAKQFNTFTDAQAAKVDALPATPRTDQEVTDIAALANAKRLRKVDVLTETVVLGEQVIGSAAGIYLGQRGAATPATGGGGTGRVDVDLVAGVLNIASIGFSTLDTPPYGSLNGATNEASIGADGVGLLSSTSTQNFIYIKRTVNKVASNLIVGNESYPLVVGTIPFRADDFINYGTVGSNFFRFVNGRTYQVNIQYSDGTFAFQMEGTPEIPGDLEWAKQSNPFLDAQVAKLAGLNQNSSQVDLSNLPEETIAVSGTELVALEPTSNVMKSVVAGTIVPLPSVTATHFAQLGITYLSGVDVAGGKKYFGDKTSKVIKVLNSDGSLSVADNIQLGSRISVLGDFAIYGNHIYVVDADDTNRRVVKIRLDTKLSVTSRYDSNELSRAGCNNLSGITFATRGDGSVILVLTSGLGNDKKLKLFYESSETYFPEGDVLLSQISTNKMTHLSNYDDASGVVFGSSEEGRHVYGINLYAGAALRNGLGFGLPLQSLGRSIGGLWVDQDNNQTIIATSRTPVVIAVDSTTVTRSVPGPPALRVLGQGALRSFLDIPQDILNAGMITNRIEQRVDNLLFLSGGVNPNLKAFYVGLQSGVTPQPGTVLYDEATRQIYSHKAHHTGSRTGIQVQQIKGPIAGNATATYGATSRNFTTAPLAQRNNGKGSIFPDGNLIAIEEFNRIDGGVVGNSTQVFWLKASLARAGTIQINNNTPYKVTASRIGVPSGYGGLSGTEYVVQTSTVERLFTIDSTYTITVRDVDGEIILGSDDVGTWDPIDRSEQTSEEFRDSHTIHVGSSNLLSDEGIQAGDREIAVPSDGSTIEHVLKFDTSLPGFNVLGDNSLYNASNGEFTLKAYSTFLFCLSLDIRTLGTLSNSARQLAAAYLKYNGNYRHGTSLYLKNANFSADAYHDVQGVISLTGTVITKAEPIKLTIVVKVANQSGATNRASVLGAHMHALEQFVYTPRSFAPEVK